MRVTVHPGDIEYGHVCPQCAGPKSLYARICRLCRLDDLRTNTLNLFTSKTARQAALKRWHK